MKLLIFTQKVDKNDSVLGFFHAWISEFAKRCENVIVICLYKGEYDLPGNVEVLSLGKENKATKFSYLLTLFKHLSNNRGQYDTVFIHMNPVYVVLCGLYFRIKRIPVYLWYVHRSVDLKLRLAVLFVKNIFSSAKESFRIKTNKVVFLGHGIETDKFPYSSHPYDGGELVLSHIGRITPIKNLEVLIEAVSKLKEKGVSIKVHFFGDCATTNDQKYKEGLVKLILEKDLQNEVIFEGAVNPKELPERLIKSHLSVNLTPPGGMDKAVLEALLLGIPVFVSNTAFKEVFADSAQLFIFEFGDSADLFQKINIFINTSRREEIIGDLSKKVREQFSLPRLIDRLVILMK